MVAKLGPGKFYGSRLSRPRIYPDVKYSHEALSWANEAHRTIGSLCTKRLRLRGRIDGNISKLRAHNEKKLIRISTKEMEKTDISDDDDDVDLVDDVPNRSASPPLAPGKRRFMALIEEDEKAEEVRFLEKEKPARELINEFNSVATTSTRRSPGSASGDKSEKPQSIGGLFSCKMKKASENLRRQRSSSSADDAMPVESEAGNSARLRVSPRLLNKKVQSAQLVVVP